MIIILRNFLGNPQFNYYQLVNKIWRIELKVKTDCLYNSYLLFESDIQQRV